MAKSAVVREALAAYLAAPAPADASSTWGRVAHLVGSLKLDQARIERDAIAKQVRDHNWR